ncbi:class I SAM-dependent methyltransferase [Alicyclobacillus fodiniaquatilis]|uniref:Class I SAM-dependent methyltransferase n=1 Tax=Alicyclobacillus fodiniaquatilis TaxID=1661150 RepID=A0ABW4JFU5_9BACL
MSDRFRDALQAVVTTPWQASAEQEKLAQALAAWFGAPCVARKDRSVQELCAKFAVEVVIVAGEPFKLYHRDADAPLFFHPSMAAQRIARRARGETDRMLRVGGIREGDIVVDATLGMAADAMVLSAAVGQTGRVIGLEQSAYVAQMLRAVQQFGSLTYPEAVQYLAKVDIIQANHSAWLAEQPDDSVDVVYFDPMFRSPNEESAALGPLRLFANRDQLQEEAVAQAKRVARRAVMVKERPSSGVFAKYQLQPDQPRRKIAYGVWRKHHE